MFSLTSLPLNFCKDRIFIESYEGLFYVRLPVLIYFSYGIKYLSCFDRVSRECIKVSRKEGLTLFKGLYRWA